MFLRVYGRNLEFKCWPPYFDDSEKRLTGGRHGYGAKLTNIFSKSFTIETSDSLRGLVYRQTWKNNMKDISDPEITRLDSKASLSSAGDSAKEDLDYTCITFVPDMDRLARGKQSVVVNLKKQEGVNVVRRLCSSADVLLEPYRPGIQPPFLCKK